MAKFPRKEPPAPRSADSVSTGDFSDPKSVDISEIHPDDVAGMDAIATAVLELQSAKKDLEDQIKEKQAILRAMIEDINDTESWTLNGPGWYIPYVRPKDRRTLSPEKLVQYGVKIEVIEKSYVYSKVSPYVSVRPAASRRDEE